MDINKVIASIHKEMEDAFCDSRNTAGDKERYNYLRGFYSGMLRAKTILQKAIDQDELKKKKQEDGLNMIKDALRGFSPEIPCRKWEPIEDK